MLLVGRVSLTGHSRLTPSLIWEVSSLIRERDSLRWEVSYSRGRNRTFGSSGAGNAAPS